MDQTTLSTIPRLLAQVLTIYSVDPEPMFIRAEIYIQGAGAEENRVSMEKMTKLWSLAVEATNNSELGLVAASLFQPTYLKGLGLAWMASANLEEGLRRFVKNSKLMNTAVSIELIEKDDELLIQYQPKLATTPAIKPATTPAVTPVIKAHPAAIQLGLGFFLKMFRLAASKNIPATAVYFKFPIEGSLAVYEEYFQCPVYGACDFNGILFSKSLLNELLPTHDPELVALNEMAVNKYLSRMDNGDITTKVIKIMTSLLASGCPSEDVIAYKTHMSKRTLQRKLRSEGQSYLTLLTSVRLMLAKQHLVMSTTSITEIAYQLAYSSPSTFARAFKKQEALSPQEYRIANS